MRNHTADALTEAKRLRQSMSLPERLLWRALRQQPGGLKFRRQHPIGRFVTDFYCAEHRLVVEIDGKSHDMGDRPANDVRRDGWLQAQGCRVIHFAAAAVLADAGAVADSLVAWCHANPPPSALRAATSPEGGGVLGSGL